MKQYLAFDLRAPMMSFGGVATANMRTTESAPTKSAVLGLLACALGIPRHQRAMHHALANNTKMVTLAYRVGQTTPSYQRDFHTVKWVEGPNKSAPMPTTRKGAVHHPHVKTMLTERDYLIDHAFTVILEVGEALHIEDLCQALRKPHWPVYIGRKSCTPSSPLNPRILEATDALSALREAHLSSFPLLAEQGVACYPGEVRWDKSLALGEVEQEHYRRDVPNDLTKTGSQRERVEHQGTYQTLTQGA